MDRGGGNSEEVGGLLDGVEDPSFAHRNSLGMAAVAALRPVTKRTGRARSETRQKKIFEFLCRVSAPARPVLWVNTSTTQEVTMPRVLLLAQVSVSPSSAGMPGAQLISQLMSWLSQLAL